MTTERMEPTTRDGQRLQRLHRPCEYEDAGDMCVYLRDILAIEQQAREQGATAERERLRASVMAMQGFTSFTGIDGEGVTFGMEPDLDGQWVQKGPVLALLAEPTP